MIILQCVKESSKLRVKFYCFINSDNNIFTNVYNNNYNCMFPKEIRSLGTFYKVNDGDIKLANRPTGKHYYSIKRQHITVMTEQEKQQLLNPPTVDISNIRIFDAGDCVICLSVASSIVFLPCAHRCLCSDCNSVLKRSKYNCPVCRVKIESDIIS